MKKKVLKDPEIDLIIMTAVDTAREAPVYQLVRNPHPENSKRGRIWAAAYREARLKEVRSW